MESIVKVDKMTINYKSRESIMGRIISTLIICYVAVTYYPLDKIVPQHGKIEHTIRSASSGTGSEKESGEYPIGAGDCTAPGNEKSKAADGLP